MMRSGMAILPTAACLVLAACASNPQLPVPFGDNALTSHSGAVGVAMTSLPKIDTSFPGASCLLCIAAASTANSALTKHTHLLSNEDLLGLKESVAARLRKNGVEAIVIAEDINIKQVKDFAAGGQNVAKKDFRPLREKYHVEHLIVIDITAAGIMRNYAAYFPTGDPMAQLTGTVSVVNLATNGYDYYAVINESKGAVGAWDEPPDFPNLSNAYYAVIDSGKSVVQAPF